MAGFIDFNLFPKIPFLNRWNPQNFLRSVIDILAIGFAFQCSYLINYWEKGGYFFTENNLAVIFIAIVPFWLLILSLIKVTKISTKRYKVLFFLYIQSTMSIFFLLILFYFVFKLYAVSRLFLIELSFLGSLYLYIIRILEFKIFEFYSAKGYIHKNIIIIADNSSLDFIEYLLSKKELGYKIVVIFSDSPLIKNKFEKTAIILQEKYLGILNDLIEVDLIDEVLYLKNKMVPSEVRESVTAYEELGVTFRIMYTDPKVSLSSAVKTDIANEKFLSFINASHNSLALAIKKTMDINMSLLIIIVSIPFFIIISALIILTSKGPVLSKQPGVGLRGRQINLYKFRTKNARAEYEDMYYDSRKEIFGTRFMVNEDHQYSKFGKFLRKSGLDELPMLFNVLKGELSVFGLFKSNQSDNMN